MMPDIKRPLVLGASGRLGTLLRGAAICAGDKAHWTSRRAGPGIVRWSGETSSLPAAETVIALWGVTAGDDTELAANTDLALRAIEIAQAIGAERVIHLSSAAIYGPGADMTERTQPGPLSAYGRAKLAMEQAIADAGAITLDQTILRLANVVGADSLAPALTRGSASLDRFPYGGGPVRSYAAPGHVWQVLRCISAQAPVAGQVETLNLCASRPVAMADLLHAAGSDIAWREAPTAAVQTVTLSAEALQRHFPKARHDWTAAQMIDDWRAAAKAIRT